jgi:CheY-like chemotaxis protein
MPSQPIDPISFGEETMCSILVIDDEKGLLIIIHEVLTQSGHHVEIAEDAVKGIQQFEDGRFDMVITDMRMPGIDGSVVVQHIRNSGKKPIAIIGMSGTPWLLEDIEFDLILPKPFSIKGLVDSVEQLIDSHELRDQ